jgi:hypothetical protein
MRNAGTAPAARTRGWRLVRVEARCGIDWTCPNHRAIHHNRATDDEHDATGDPRSAAAAVLTILAPSELDAPAADTLIDMAASFRAMMWSYTLPLCRPTKCEILAISRVAAPWICPAFPASYAQTPPAAPVGRLRRLGRPPGSDRPMRAVSTRPGRSPAICRSERQSRRAGPGGRPPGLSRPRRRSAANRSIARGRMSYRRERDIAPAEPGEGRPGPVEWISPPGDTSRPAEPGSERCCAPQDARPRPVRPRA